jgi:hypothetical protein
VEEVSAVEIAWLEVTVAAEVVEAAAAGVDNNLGEGLLFKRLSPFILLKTRKTCI